MTVGDLIKNMDYDYISWRVTHPDFQEGIFIGSCHSKSGELIPDDQDYYSPNEDVLSYEEWYDEKNDMLGLTVIVEGEWMRGRL